MVVMMDVVFPRNNEKEFIEMAKTLGFDELVFVYQSKADFYRGESAVKVHNALLCGEKKVQKDFFCFVKNPEDARFVFEKSRPFCVFELEIQVKDFMHHRGSGFNHVMARFAAEKGVHVGFSFRSILNSSPVQRAQVIGRLKQNIRLARKYKVNTIVASFAESPFEMRSPHDLMNLFTVFGMHPKEAKDSLSRAFRKEKKESAVDVGLID